jgi:hypothetical protein
MLMLLSLSILCGCAYRNLYSDGQFVEQTNFIKLNHPEPEDYNPKANDLFKCPSGRWMKRCEWWCAEDIEGQ